MFHSSLLYYAECSIQINYPFLLILLSPLYSFRQPNICRFVACSNFSILLSLALNFLPHFCCCNYFARSLFVVSNQFGKWCATFEFDAWDWNAIVTQKKHDKIRMYVSFSRHCCLLFQLRAQFKYHQQFAQWLSTVHIGLQFKRLLNRLNSTREGSFINIAIENRLFSFFSPSSDSFTPIAQLYVCHIHNFHAYYCHNNC